MILQIETRKIEPDITVLQLTGKVTRGREGERVELLVQDLVRQENKKIILDLTGVNYVDSGGLGIITLCFGTVTEAGGAFRLAGASGLTERLLSITKLQTIIPCHPTVEAARESLAAGDAPQRP